MLDPEICKWATATMAQSSFSVIRPTLSRRAAAGGRGDGGGGGG